MNARTSRAMRAIAVCSVATLGVLGVAIGARSAPTDPVRAVVVDAATAQDSVAGLVTAAEARGLSVSRVVAGTVDSFYEVTSKSVRGTVDVNDGRVTSLLRQTKLPTGTDAIVSAPDAQAAAETWLDSHHIPRDGLSAKVELVDHGDTVAFTVNFTRILGGVLLPDSRTVYVNAASGEIFMLADYRHPFGPPPDAKLSVSEAIAAARAAVGGRNPSIEREQLQVAFAPDGSQRLVWVVAIGAELDDSLADDPLVAHYLVEVDALDGTARVTAQG